MQSPVRIWIAGGVAVGVLFGCARPEGYDDGGFGRSSGSTEFKVEGRSDGGFLLTVRLAQYQMIPAIEAIEERCRREAAALAADELERAPILNARVDRERIRSSAGRNIVSGVSSCTASVPVVVEIRKGAGAAVAGPLKS